MERGKTLVCGPYRSVPLVRLRDTGFVTGQVALKAESDKVVKYEKACLKNQHIFEIM
ncbi:hypothetical protein R6Q57_005094 [Mikania cordata]